MNTPHGMPRIGGTTATPATAIVVDVDRAGLTGLALVAQAPAVRGLVGPVALADGALHPRRPRALRRNLRSFMRAALMVRALVVRVRAGPAPAALGPAVPAAGINPRPHPHRHLRPIPAAVVGPVGPALVGRVVPAPVALALAAAEGLALVAPAAGSNPGLIPAAAAAPVGPALVDLAALALVAAVAPVPVAAAGSNPGPIPAGVAALGPVVPVPEGPGLVDLALAVQALAAQVPVDLAPVDLVGAIQLRRPNPVRTHFSTLRRRPSRLGPMTRFPPRFSLGKTAHCA